MVVRASAQQLTIRIETQKKSGKQKKLVAADFAETNGDHKRGIRKKKSSDGRTRERLELVALASFDLLLLGVTVCALAQ